MEAMIHDPSSDITEIQRKKLFVPQDKSFTIPLKYIEVISEIKKNSENVSGKKKVNINEQNIKNLISPIARLTLRNFYAHDLREVNGKKKIRQKKIKQR